MEDLLREEDFKTTPDFNYKKYFRKYYLIAVASIGAYIVAVALLRYVLNSMFIGILFFSIAVVLSFVMVFRKPEVLLLENSIIIRGIFYLTCVYFLPFLIGFIFFNPIALLGIIIIWILSMTIILVPVLLRANAAKRKLLKY